MKRVILLFKIFLVGINIIGAHCQNHDQFIPNNICLERTDIFSLHSDIIDQDFEISISLPHSYFAKDTVFPAIYLIDPYRAFHTVREYTDGLTKPHNYIPQVIIIGIGYGGNGPQEVINWVVGRTRDLTPVKDARTEAYFERILSRAGASGYSIKTGGGPNFLEFISKELFPVLEEKYRIDSNHRLLAGYSFGGLFALYTLFHQPQMFDKYLIGSPSLHYADGIAFQYESDYLDDHSDLNADVFISAGEKEELTSLNVNKMNEALNSRNYKNLNVTMSIFEKEDHVTAYLPTIARGIIELLGKAPID